MHRFSRILTVLFIALFLFGCGIKKRLTEAVVSKDVSHRSAIAVLDSAKDDKYTPPADGRLTDAQVQMYLKIRDREHVIAQVAAKDLQDRAKKSEGKTNSLSDIVGAFGSVADLSLSGVRAAKELGYNSEEYGWVKSQVLEASGSDRSNKVAQIANAAAGARRVELQKAIDDSPDASSKQVNVEALADFDKTLKETNEEQKDVSPAVVYNRQLLSKYENAMTALASEFTKGVPDSDDLKKKGAEWQKNFDKALQEAKEGNAPK